MLRSLVGSEMCIRDSSDLLAPPITFIYNQVIRDKEWPDLWKRETLIVIPKCGSPSELSECRNLACTPLFSKVLEGFILSRLREEMSLAETQYGGLKGCSSTHFLVQTWNDIMEGLEDNRACVNLLSVDFAKAFNRMGHHECLRALCDHGASEDSIKLAGAFLTGRTMRVRIGDHLSDPRLINCLLYTSPSPRDS